MAKIVFCELYAGLASVSLHLLGHKPPVSRIGAKTGYAAAVIEALGVERRDVRKFLLVDSDPSIVAVLRSLVCESSRMAVVSYLRRWPATREWWERLRGYTYGPQEMEAARWLFVTAASRGGIGGFKGKHKRRPSVRGFIPTIPSLCDRIEALDLDPAMFAIRQAHAGSIRPFKNAVVYLDPPYADRQGYDVELLQHSAEHVFKQWRAAGARVGLSEGRRLDIPKARVIDITKRRRGQYRRSLTTSSAEYLHLGGV